MYSTVISHSGDEKYIIVRINNKVAKTHRHMLVSHAVKYHSQIAARLETELAQNEWMTVLGGGILTVDAQAKKISTYGQSGGYGPPDLQIVRKILENSSGFEDYLFDLKVTDYIRD